MEEPNAVDSASRTAAEILQGKTEGDGKPSPSRHGGRRPGAGRKAKSGTKAKTSAKPAEPEPMSAAEIEGYTMLGGFAWKLAAGIFKLDDLNDEERDSLGEALAAVGAKYAPAMGAWMPEINLALVVGGLYMMKRKPDLVIEGARDFNERERPDGSHLGIRSPLDQRDGF